MTESQTTDQPLTVADRLIFMARRLTERAQYRQDEVDLLIEAARIIEEVSPTPISHSDTTAYRRIMAGMKDARLMTKQARIISNFCHLKGWAAKWDQLSPDERNEFIGVVETLKEQKP